MQIALVQVTRQQVQLRSAYVRSRHSRLCWHDSAVVSHWPPKPLRAAIGAWKLCETARQRLAATQLIVTPRDTEEGWSANRLDSCSTRRCDPSMEPKYGAKSPQKPVQRSPSIRSVRGSCCPHNAGLHAAGPLSMMLVGTRLRKRSPSSLSEDHPRREEK